MGRRDRAEVIWNPEEVWHLFPCSPGPFLLIMSRKEEIRFGLREGWLSEKLADRPIGLVD